MSGSPIHTGIMYHQVSIFSQKDIGITEAASIFAIVAPSMIFGQFISGILNNYFDPRKILILGQVLVFLTLYLLSILNTLFFGYIYGIIRKKIKKVIMKKLKINLIILKLVITLIIYL